MINDFFEENVKCFFRFRMVSPLLPLLQMFLEMDLFLWSSSLIDLLDKQNMQVLGYLHH